MSTPADYLAAKEVFETHTAQHGCKPKLIAQEQGVDTCSTREALWAQMQRVASRL